MKRIGFEAIISEHLPMVSVEKNTEQFKNRSIKCPIFNINICQLFMLVYYQTLTYY